MYSDNAQTFIAANKELMDRTKVLCDHDTQHFCVDHNFTWKFIAPLAAWWLGFCERMVGSIERWLRKVLGRSKLDEEGLSTILASIEAALNSRPITEDLDTGEILTPSHFLIGKRLIAIP